MTAPDPTAPAAREGAGGVFHDADDADFLEQLAADLAADGCRRSATRLRHIVAKSRAERAALLRALAAPPAPACDCASCRAARENRPPYSCCPQRLTHGAFCICGATIAEAPPAPAPAGEACTCVGIVDSGHSRGCPARATDDAAFLREISYRHTALDRDEGIRLRAIASQVARLRTAPAPAAGAAGEAGEGAREWIVIAGGHGSVERPDYPPALRLLTRAEAEAEADRWCCHADTIGGTASVVRAVDYIETQHRQRAPGAADARAREEAAGELYARLAELETMHEGAFLQMGIRAALDDYERMAHSARRAAGEVGS